LHKSFALPDYGQVEGMCVTPNAEVWFTQEGSFFSNHKMVKLKIAN
jgi:streptogramin lyase